MTSNQNVMALGHRRTWNRTRFDSYLVAASLGILAGLLVSYVNTPLHMPGHKALFWIVPAVAYRIRSGSKGAATTTVTAAQITALLLGGSLAGGYVMAPLVILAGIILDFAIHMIERHRVTARTAFTLLALAGMLGNLLCFIKRLANPLGPFLSSANLQDLGMAAGSHLLFGMMGALIGCGIGFLMRSRPFNR